MEQEKRDYYFRIMGKVIILAFIALGVFVAYKLTMFYIPFLIAFVVALLVEPLINFFMKKMKLKRKVASIIALLLVVIVIGTVLTLLVGKLVSESTILIGNLNDYFKDTYDWLMEWINDWQEGRIQIAPETMDFVKNALGSVLEAMKGFIYNAVTGIVNFATSVPNIITSTFITILAIIFMCFDRDYVIEMIKKHFPSKWISGAKRVVHETCSITWNYVKAEMKLSLLCFCLVFVGLIIFDLVGLDIKYTVLFAVTIGFVDLLPLFGAGAVMLPWAVYLLLTGNIPLAIAVAALWCVWAVIKQLLEPKVVSKQMGLHPIFTLLAMYTGFKLLGVLGLMVGPIILLVIKSIFSELIEKGILKSFFELD